MTWGGGLLDGWGGWRALTAAPHPGAARSAPGQLGGLGWGDCAGGPPRGVVLSEEAQDPVQECDPAFLGNPEVVGNGVGEVSSWVSTEPMGTWAPVLAPTCWRCGRTCGFCVGLCHLPAVWLAAGWVPCVWEMCGLAASHSSVRVLTLWSSGYRFRGCTSFFFLFCGYHVGCFDDDYSHGSAGGIGDTRWALSRMRSKDTKFSVSTSSDGLIWVWLT